MNNKAIAPLSANKNLKKEMSFNPAVSDDELKYIYFNLMNVDFLPLRTGQHYDPNLPNKIHVDEMIIGVGDNFDNVEIYPRESKMIKNGYKGEIEDEIRQILSSQNLSRVGIAGKQEAFSKILWFKLDKSLLATEGMTEYSKVQAKYFLKILENEDLYRHWKFTKLMKALVTHSEKITPEIMDSIKKEEHVDKNVALLTMMLYFFPQVQYLALEDFLSPSWEKSERLNHIKDQFKFLIVRLINSDFVDNGEPQKSIPKI